MSTSIEQIENWLNAPSEDENLEFKEAKTGYDSVKLHKYCVALANEGGGQLILGVTDKKPRSVVGTTAIDNPGAMQSKLFSKLRFRVDIEEVKHPAGRLVVFHIPGRPAGSAYQFEGAYLMRVGEELVPMTEDQLRTIFNEGKPGLLEQPATGLVSGQDVIQLLDTQTYFDLLKLPYPSDRTGVLGRLESERLISTRSAGYTISKLAAVMLAKELRSFEEVYRKAARVVVYSGTNKLNTISDTTGAKGYAVGFQGLVSHVMGHLPQNEVLTDALRRESKLLPEVVIRELLANALIHQDFDLTGMSPMVEIYSDRVEISNPGQPVVPLERLIDAYQSRNERLADFMRRFGVCEEKGSGIDRTVHAAEVHQLPAPDFQVNLARTIVIVFGPRSFKNMGRSERVRACYQHCALQYVFRRPMTNQSLRERFKLSPSSSNTISTIISATMDAGMIKADPDAPSGKKYARYLPFWA